MNPPHALTSLILATASLCLSCTATTTQDLHGEAPHAKIKITNQQSLSRLLRRRDKTDEQQLQTDDWMDDDDIQIVFGDDDVDDMSGSEPALQNPCKSVIAMGGMRLRSTLNDATNSTIDDFNYDPINRVILYDAHEELSTEEELYVNSTMGRPCRLKGLKSR